MRSSVVFMDMVNIGTHEIAAFTVLSKWTLILRSGSYAKVYSGNFIYDLFLIIPVYVSRI